MEEKSPHFSVKLCLAISRIVSNDINVFDDSDKRREITAELFALLGDYRENVMHYPFSGDGGRKVTLSFGGRVRLSEVDILYNTQHPL